MLIILSDIHLADGTCAKPVSQAAFDLFVDRLEEIAFNASWREDGHYRPLERIDILLLGDILECLHSTLWLQDENGQPHDIRPWSDFRDPVYAALLDKITVSILKKNAGSIDLLRRLTEKGLGLTPPTQKGLPALKTRERIPVPVRIFYLVGNHDWYYHIPGQAFEAVRERIRQAFGLSNAPGPFPHEVRESDELRALMAEYEIYAQHGDLYDNLNYWKEKGRNAASLGDALGVEVFNRFPLEVEKQMGADLPAGIVDSLRELVNVRPALAVPLWISSQLRQNNVPRKRQEKLKSIWDELCNQFLAMPMVREADRRFQFDLVDGLEVAIKLTDRISFKTLDDLVIWMRKKMWGNEISFAHFALREEAFLKRKARFIVYGHTHHHEVVPLDSIPIGPHKTNQMYLNSGTWHTYYDLALYKPEEQKFVPYQVLTYLSFYKDDERGGRRFETWSGTFSD